MNNKTTKYAFPVEGMTCASCVARVEKALIKINGIENVPVNFANEKVAFESSQKNIVEKAVTAVEKYGYKLLVNEKSNEEEKKDKNYEKLKHDILFSVILSVSVIGNSLRLKKSTGAF